MATWVRGPAELPSRHRALVEHPIIGTLCTLGRDGPMLSAVWYEWADGGMSCSVPPDGVIERNIRRNPWAALLIAGADRPYCGIEYRGEVTARDDYLPVLTRLAIRYLGADAGAEYLVGHPVNLHLRMQHGRFRLWDDAL
jgi:pyridoxamine 5'-phosphate oxidase-like protein